MTTIRRWKIQVKIVINNVNQNKERVPEDTPNSTSLKSINGCSVNTCVQLLSM